MRFISTPTTCAPISARILDSLKPIASSRRAAWDGCAITSSVSAPSRVLISSARLRRRARPFRAAAFEDTNRMFVAPEAFDLRVHAEGPPEFWAEQGVTLLRPPRKPRYRGA